MNKRIGACLRCGSCCRSFTILSGAMSDFKRAQEKYGLRLISNSDKTYRCNMLDVKTNLCEIHKDKPRACREAPRGPFPKEWNCGYKFVYVDTRTKEVKKTKEALDFFSNLPKIKKMDERTQFLLCKGRKYATKDQNKPNNS